ncbi:MAG: DUF2914 domain-containing protein [Myxococcales bacterium]|nr:DUF2914 domain-containing protein [Myxococcales bacterium]
MRRALWVAVMVLAGARAASAAPELVQAVACHDVVEREPVGVAERFAPGVVWLYLRLASDAAAQVELVWRRDGDEVQRTTLKVGRGKRWRTWARHRTEPGAWRVDVLHRGRRLGRVRFRVAADAAPAALAPTQPAVEAPAVEAPAADAPPVGEPQTDEPAADAPVPDARDADEPDADEPAADAPPPAAPPPPPPDPEDAPAPRAAPTIVALPAEVEPEPLACRAWVSVASDDAGAPHAIIDVDVAAGVARAVTPGLLVRDGRALHVLRLHPHRVDERGRYGSVRRAWDLLMGAQVPDGPPVTWHGYPATLAPPGADAPRGAVFDESNRLHVLGIYGPFVALRADLGGFAGEGKDFDHSRHAWVRAPGQTADPVASMVGHPARAVAAWLAAHPYRGEGPAPTVDGHDFKRSALVWDAGQLTLRTLVRCCTFAANRNHVEVALPVQPKEALARRLPDDTGAWVDPRGCGAVALRDGRLLARLGNGGPKPVRAASTARPTKLLGVVWVRPRDRWSWDEVRQVSARLAPRRK